MEPQGSDRWNWVRLGVALWCVGAGLGLFGPSVFGQESPPRITTVEYAGLVQQTLTFARGVVRVRAGSPLDTSELDAAVTRLLRTGRFLAATYRLTEEEGGMRVTFELRERRMIAAVRFEGNAKFSDGKLREEAALKVGDPADRFSIRGGRDGIVSAYREAGYSDVVVSVDEAQIDQTGEVAFRIEEGPRTRIRRIAFEGNTSISAYRLKRQIETKAALWIFRSGALDVDRIEGDVAHLQNYYRGQGFLDARASYRREVDEEGDVAIVFMIVEGTRYKIETIQFLGESVFSTDELLGLIGSRVGETVKQATIDADARTVHSRHGELGYIYANVRPTWVFSETPGLVRVTMHIDQGDSFRVDRVVVRGNMRTRDKVVRRALNLYPPDDLFNLSEAREAERRLVESRVFSSARVLAVGSEPGVRTAVVDVAEAEKVGDFLFGFGVSTNSGLVGNVVLDQKNFDLFDPPRSFSELVKFRSFFGGGQHLRIEVQPGQDVNRFRVDFTEPYLFDQPLRFDSSFYLFERGRESYTERRGGVMFSLGKRFERGWLRGWSAEAAIRAEDASVDDLDLFAARSIREAEGSNIMTSVKLSLVRDATDNRFVPTRGGRFRLGYEQFGALGGDHDFGRLIAGYTWYKTLRTDNQDRKSVLKLKAEGGAIIGDAPVFERFYAGGTGSIRGFKFRGVGPREGLQDDNIGGDYLVLLGSEYSFPLYGDTIRGLVFLDTGTVDSGAWRASIGAGIRLTVNVFGPLPLEFALALPFSSDSDDDTQAFSFMIGGLF